MILLFDQDGPLADFDGAFAARFAELHPDAPVVDVRARTQFKITGSYPDHLHRAINAIYQEVGFYENLPLVPGALDGLQSLLEAGHEVFICTSPLTEYRNCVAEKFAWVEKNLGSEWLKRLVITKDKTVVGGSVLVDDKPHVTGAVTPTWTHVRYTTSYNAHLVDVPRFSWATAAADLAAVGVRDAA